MARLVVFFVLNLHIALSSYPPRYHHIDADPDTILSLLDKYTADSLELKEGVRGDERLLILQDSSLHGQSAASPDRLTSQATTTSQTPPSSGSGSFGASGSGSGDGSSVSGSGRSTNSLSGDGSAGSSASASGSGGGSTASGSGDVMETSREVLFRQWLSDELLRMTTVVYDCKDGNETIGDWRDEAVGEWLMEWSSSHTQDSSTSASGTAGGSGLEDKPKRREERFIFGEDEREFVTRSSDFPQCAIARMSTGCTAFFISPYHALTAGHCVNNFRYGWKRNIRLWRERNCRNKGIISTCSRVFSIFGHTHLKLYDYDYALIELERNGNPAPCWFGIGYVHPWDYPSSAGLEILGYPSDKRWYTGQPGCTYEAMWLSSCNVSYSHRQNLLQWCDAVSGNSGSPVFSDTARDKVVYGIHAQSIGHYVYDDEGNRELEELWNQGPMITPLRYHQILRWMEVAH